MNYEEKYKQALEKVKGLLKDQEMALHAREKLANVFPELAESEDEKIRKCVKYAVDKLFLKEKIVCDVHKEDVLAWLEEQGKQKPADMVEPKLHEGDWIISNNKKSTYQVIEVKRGIYVIRDNADNHEYHIGIEECEKSGRLWSISDAKDGDVLATSAGAFIYNSKNGGDSRPGYYCGINTLGKFQISIRSGNKWTNKEVYPATKEQRKFLFKKMQEAGYEWRQEDKKLIKMKETKFKEGDYIVPYNITPLEIWKVINIDKDGYYNIQPIINVINTEDDKIYRVPAFILEEDYHLWTIEDAKDGDVLAINWHEYDDSWEKIIIFKKYHNKGVKGLYSMPCVEGYGNTFKNGKLAFQEEIPYYSETWTANLHPATKEQRDLLFKKIHDAGYEWDAEKKGLTIKQAER